MQKVKIVSGWSNPGGSTIHHIGLTNLLNDAGYDCTFYGPHQWHLDRCKAAHISECKLSEEDILISHFIQPPPTKVKKHILSCHETNLFPLKQIPTRPYDLVHFVSINQRDWHGVDVPCAVIPPRVDAISWKSPKNNVAGVVGSIDEHKQTHKAIALALNDGFEKILLFGQITDLPYFQERIQPLLGSVEVRNHEDDKEAMYGAVEAVYHASKRETYGLVEAECNLAKIPFRGKINNPEILSDEEILQRWKEILN
jgi:hypothetical protein